MPRANPIPAVVVMAATVPVAAQWISGEWEQVSIGPYGPGPRGGAAMVYDPNVGAVLLHGGGTHGGTLGDTWAWNGSAWRQLAFQGPPKGSHKLVFDSRRGVVVTFGGLDRGNHNDQTWEWDGAVWRQVPVAGPSARDDYALAYDERRGRTVLFGGDDDLLQEGVWEYDGVSWEEVPSNGPLSRWGMGMAYDPRSGESLLFGGYRAGGETLAWNGQRWRLRNIFGPEVRTYHAMFREAGSDLVFMHGGQDAHGARLGDTLFWSPEYNDWWQLAELSSERSAPAVAYDPLRRALVLYGGFTPGGTPVSDTWELRLGCYPDCDTSTGAFTLDIFDFLCFQNLYARGDPYACDCDTGSFPGCDIFDFLCFQNAFDAGCP